MIDTGNLEDLFSELLDALLSLKGCVISAKGNFAVDDLKAQVALRKANTAIAKANASLPCK